MSHNSVPSSAGFRQALGAILSLYAIGGELAFQPPQQCSLCPQKPPADSGCNPNLT